MDPSPTVPIGPTARRTGALALCLVIGLAAMAAAASPAQAVGVLNSECAPGHEGFAIVSNGSEWVQTFPAKRSGKLLTVELKNLARASGGTGADVVVRLYATEEDGTPKEPSLASTTIAGGGIATDNMYHDYIANFEPGSAAFLTAGKAYGIGVGTEDTAQNSWAFHPGNLCAEGELFGHYLGFTANPDLDAGVTTYVGPANDDFERAEVLAGRVAAAEGTTAGATRQAGEPDHYVTDPPDSDLWEGDHTVWFKWKAPNTGPTTIDTCLGEIDSILAVYTGNELQSLTRVADNNNDPACSANDVYGSKVSFEAVGGTTYDIAVGDAGGAREKPFAIRIVGSTDITPPETQIDSGPVGPTTNASPAFAFSASEPGSTFECRLDSTQESAFAPCASPKAYASLSLGNHNFEVRATDEAANVDPSPASRSFTIEAPPPGQHSGSAASSTGPPDTRISKARISQAKDRATFRFGSTEPGSTFVCRIDRKPAKPCHSPKSYGHLKPGRHTFSVDAVGAAGATDPTPALRKFRITP
jgi:hypothetical protein